MLPPTPEELQTLTVKERQELWDAHRQRPLQAITSLTTAVGVLLGVIFTAFGLVYTARTLAATQEGQVTDRYNKAVEQLASPAADARLGAIYALQRIAMDSPRDRPTIRNLLAAYTRNHDSCSIKSPPKQCAADDPKSDPHTLLARLQVPVDTRAALDVSFALTAVGDLPLELSLARFPLTNLGRVNLAGVNLASANLRNADLGYAQLAQAILRGADLNGAFLDGADLRGANLGLDGVAGQVDLRKASLNGAKLNNVNLNGAFLNGAILVDADLRDADLSVTRLEGADLRGADLRGTKLARAHLSGVILDTADLRGADLTEVVGITPDQIREVAMTDATTKF